MPGLNGNRINLNTQGAMPLADTVGGAAGTVTGTERARLQAMSSISDVTYRSVKANDDGTTGSGRIYIGDDGYFEDFDSSGEVRWLHQGGLGTDSNISVARGGVTKRLLTAQEVNTKIYSNSATPVGAPSPFPIAHGAGTMPTSAQVFRQSGGSWVNHADFSFDGTFVYINSHTNGVAYRVVVQVIVF